MYKISEKYNFEGASARHTLKIPLYKKIDQSQVPTIQKAIDSMEKNIFGSILFRILLENSINFETFLFFYTKLIITGILINDDCFPFSSK